MKHLFSILVILLMSVNCFAESIPRLVRSYMDQHAAVWNSGKVCRHAAAELADRAELENIIYRAPMYTDVDRRYAGHVLFAMQYGSKWYFIDSIGDRNHYMAICKIYPDYIPEDTAGLSDIFGRDLDIYEGDASDELLYMWAHEKETIDILRSQIDEQLEVIKELRKSIEKLHNVFIALHNEVKELSK